MRSTMPVYRTVSAWLSRQRQAREKDSVTLRDRELALRSTTRYHTIPPPIPPVPRAFHPALLEPFAYTTEGTPAPSTSTTRAFTPISSAPTTTGESSPATASNPLTLGSTLPISLGTTSQYEWGAYVRGALAEKTATRGVRRAAASSPSSRRAPCPDVCCKTDAVQAGGGRVYQRVSAGGCKAEGARDICLSSRSKSFDSSPFLEPYTWTTTAAVTQGTARRLDTGTDGDAHQWGPGRYRNDGGNLHASCNERDHPDPPAAPPPQDGRASAR